MACLSQAPALLPPRPPSSFPGTLAPGLFLTQGSSHSVYPFSTWLLPLGIVAVRFIRVCVHRCEWFILVIIECSIKKPAASLFPVSGHWGIGFAHSFGFMNKAAACKQSRLLVAGLVPWWRRAHLGHRLLCRGYCRSDTYRRGLVVPCLPATCGFQLLSILAAPGILRFFTPVV